MPEEDIDALLREARETNEKNEQAHGRWMAKTTTGSDDFVRAYKHAEAHNKGKAKDDPKLPLPEMADIVGARHFLICTPSEREPEWYELDPATKRYDPVESITALIVLVLDELDIPTKQTNTLVGNVKTRLRGRCTINGLQRTPSIISFDKRRAHSFHELNQLRPDKNPIGYPVACKSCWYLVTRDGEFKKRNYDKGVFLLNRLEADPDQGEPTYTEAWLNERVGQEQADAVWEWASYCLTPHNTFKKFHVWFGNSDTGKSTGVGLLELILGAHNVGAQSAHNLDYTRHKFATSALRGKLLNVSEEDPGYGNAFEKAVKSITGGGTVSWEVKNGPSGEERPTYRLLFTTNETPKIVDNSDAFANRIIALHWDRPIEGKKATIEEITRKFRAELPQILWKCLHLRKSIASGLRVPEVSRVLLARILQESSEVGTWFNEHIKFAPDTEWVSNEELYDSYRTWCVANGEQAASHIIFGKRLRRLPAFREERFQEKKRKPKGEKGSVRGYTGLRLRETTGQKVCD